MHCWLAANPTEHSFFIAPGNQVSCSKFALTTAVSLPDPPDDAPAFPEESVVCSATLPVLGWTDSIPLVITAGWAAQSLQNSFSH